MTSTKRLPPGGRPISLAATADVIGGSYTGRPVILLDSRLVCPELSFPERVLIAEFQDSGLILRLPTEGHSAGTAVDEPPSLVDAAVVLSGVPRERPWSAVLGSGDEGRYPGLSELFAHVRGHSDQSDPADEPLLIEVEALERIGWLELQLRHAERRLARAQKRSNDTFRELCALRGEAENLHQTSVELSNVIFASGLASPALAYELPPDLERRLDGFPSQDPVGQVCQPTVVVQELGVACRGLAGIELYFDAPLEESIEVRLEAKEAAVVLATWHIDRAPQGWNRLTFPQVLGGALYTAVLRAIFPRKQSFAPAIESLYARSSVVNGVTQTRAIALRTWLGLAGTRLSGFGPAQPLISQRVDLSSVGKNLTSPVISGQAAFELLYKGSDSFFIHGLSDEAVYTTLDLAHLPSGVMDFSISVVNGEQAPESFVGIGFVREPHELGRLEELFEWVPLGAGESAVLRLRSLGDAGHLVFGVRIRYPEGGQDFALSQWRDACLAALGVSQSAVHVAVLGGRQ